MLTISRLVASLLLLFSVSCPSLFAQEKAAESHPTPIVTATVSAERLRFTTPAPDIIAMRLEVYTEDGQRLSDSGFKPGTLLDWAMVNEQGQRYDAGKYLCVVTIKNLSGRVSRKLGTLTISTESAAALEPTEAPQLSAAQLRVLSGAENSSALSILREGKGRSAVVTAHDGQDGQVTSTSGSLTFRTGDVFSGKEREQVRITPEGQVGIGTDKPEAALDVAGTINARGGIRFNDGSILTSAGQAGKGGSTQTVNAAIGTTTTAAISGAGTANTLPKWNDNAGTLGDSSISEVNGNIGIGTSTPREGFTAFSSTGTAKYLMSEWGSGGTVALGGDNSVGPFLVSHTDSQGKATGNYTASRLRFGAQGVGFDVSPVTTAGQPRTWTQQAILDASGNFGLGTLSPTQKLDVAGNIKIGGVGNGIIFPDGTKMTTAPDGSGSAPSGASIVAAINDPATTGTISDSRLSGNVARLNSTNTFTGNQAVSGDLAVTGKLTASSVNLNGTLNPAPGVVYGSGIIARYADFTYLTVDKGNFVVDNLFHRVGIGTVVPQAELEVRGTVLAGGVTAGGLRTGSVTFSDGSIQKTAASKVYTSFLTAPDIELAPRNASGAPVFTNVLQLDLPTGVHPYNISYDLMATVQFENTANLFAQNNSRSVTCKIGNQTWSFRLGSSGTPMDQFPMTLHTVINAPQTSTPNTSLVTLACGVNDGGTDRSYVFTRARRFTANKVESLVTQP